MSDDDFEYDPLVQSLLEIMSGVESDATQVAAAIAQAAALPEAARFYIADMLEKDLIRPDMDSELEDMKRMRQSALEELVLPAPMFAIPGLITKFIAEAKGDKASPFVQIYASEAPVPTTPAEYLDGFISALEAVQKWPEIQAARKAKQEQEQQEEASRAAQQAAQTTHQKLQILRPARNPLKRAR